VADTTRTGKAYTGDGVDVYFDARRCLHFAECVRGLPAVFDVKQRPWIQPANAQADEIAEVVRRCPSGALHYVLHDGPAEEPERPTRVEFVEGGPITLRGELELDTPDGTVSEVRAALCRCGQTENGPYCDNACRG
jgi:uncharacterized Fe-S cluster protein YjdI/CDGSH-type Zn-finger protein